MINIICTNVNISAMKRLIVIILLIIFETQVQGQDGSDIQYLKTSFVDNSFAGHFVQFAFYRKSFQINSFSNAEESCALDTIIICLDNIPVKFIEHRVDDGLNNWFSEQYLQSVDKINGETIRVSKFKLDSVTTNLFMVTMYVDFYDKENNIRADESRQIKYQFEKKDIIGVLVQSEQPVKNQVGKYNEDGNKQAAIFYPSSEFKIAQPEKKKKALYV